MTTTTPTWGNPVRPARGDIWHADGGTITVSRVSRPCGCTPPCPGWADIRVTQDHTGATWTKRQPLPFPAAWRRAEVVA